MFPEIAIASSTGHIECCKRDSLIYAWIEMHKNAIQKKIDLKKKNYVSIDRNWKRKEKKRCVRMCVCFACICASLLVYQFEIINIYISNESDWKRYAWSHLKQYRRLTQKWWKTNYYDYKERNWNICIDYSYVFRSGGGDVCFQARYNYREEKKEDTNKLKIPIIIPMHIRTHNIYISRNIEC